MGKVSFVRRVRTIDERDAVEAAAFFQRAFPFGARLQNLSGLFRKLIAEETFCGVAVDYIWEGSPETELAAFGLSAFIREDYVAAYLESPAPHFEITVIASALAGEPVFLTYDEIATANASSGVTLFPLLWLQKTMDPSDPEAHVLFGIREKTFWERHRGYRLARVIKEVPAVVERAFLEGGFREQCRFMAGAPLGAFPNVALDQDSIMFTMTRAEAEAHWPPSVIGQLFACQEPRCGFSRAEQQVLIRAADGLTDAKIADSLGITQAAVSLRWRSIYGRLAECVPAALRAEEDDANGARGQEKRRTVVAFVEQHPEELRPYTRPARRHANGNHRAAAV